MLLGSCLRNNCSSPLLSEAGCIAQKMGLPIRLVAAVNCNDIIHRTVQRGDFSLSETVKPTLASAMDIQVGPVGRCVGLVRCWGCRDWPGLRSECQDPAFLPRCPTTWRGFSGCSLTLTARGQETSWSNLKGPEVCVYLRICKGRSVTTHIPQRKRRVQMTQPDLGFENLFEGRGHLLLEHLLWAWNFCSHVI